MLWSQDNMSWSQISISILRPRFTTLRPEIGGGSVNKYQTWISHNNLRNKKVKKK